MNEDAKVEEEGEVEYFEDYHGRLSRSRELSDRLVQPGPTKHWEPKGRKGKWEQWEEKINSGKANGRGCGSYSVEWELESH